MPRVMCVHPDAESLEAWRRLLLEQRHGWEVEPFAAVSAAWARLRECPPDVIVAPMCVALDGRVLLAQVRDEQPEVARVLVAGGVCDERVVEGQRVAQRVLPDDVEPAAFVEALSQVLKRREIIAQPELRAVLGKVGQLPAAPEVHTRLVRRLRDPNVTLDELAELVREDAALEPRAPWNEAAFTAGLLQDVGRLILAVHMPQDYARIEQRAAREGFPRHVVERELLGTDHAALAMVAGTGRAAGRGRHDRLTSQLCDEPPTVLVARPDEPAPPAYAADLDRRGRRATVPA